MEFRFDSQIKWRLAAAGSGLAPRAPYRLGDLIDVADALPDAVELRGWSAIEETGAWSDGPEAHLDVTMAAEARGHPLDVVLWLTPFDSAAGGQRIRLHAGGALLGTAQLTEPVRLRVAMPAWNDPRRPVRLSFELPDCTSPEALGLGNDRRRLAVKLAALAVVRHGDATPEFLRHNDWQTTSVQDGAVPPAPVGPPPELPAASPAPPPPAPPGRGLASKVVWLGAAAQQEEGIAALGFGAANDPHGRWTVERRASLRLAFSDMPDEPLAVDLLLSAYVPGHHGQDVTFTCDAESIGRLVIDGGDDVAFLVRLPVPPGGCTISFSLPLATSPRAEGESIDDRLLGVRLLALKVGPRRVAPERVLRPTGSGFADFTATQGTIMAMVLPRRRGGPVARLGSAIRRRAKYLRTFFAGGLDNRTRMAAQMSGDVLRAVEALERGLDERNEALAEAVRVAVDGQNRQIAGRLSDLRADLDMRVASINAAISGLASRQGEIEQGVARLLDPAAGTVAQVSRALAGSSDALKLGFSSLSDALRRAGTVQAGRHDDLVDGLEDIRKEFAALEEDLRMRLAGSASTLKAGFGSLAESLRRNLQTNSGGFAMLGGEAAAMRLRLSEMETALNEHVSGAAAQMRSGLAQLADSNDQRVRHDELKALIAAALAADSNDQTLRASELAQLGSEISAFRAEFENRISQLGDTTDQGARHDELTALIGAIQSAGSHDQTQRTRALTVLSNEISTFRAEIEGRISLLGDTTRQFSGTALQMLHAQQDALGETTTRLGILADSAGKPSSELAELRTMLARTAERMESGLQLDADLLIAAHTKLDASAHRLTVDLDAQTRAIRTSQGFLLVPRLDAQLMLMLIESAGTYEPGLSRLMSRVVQPGMRVADVGANVGYHTLHLARLVGARGWVTAVEPTPELARILRRMLALNNVDAISDVVTVAAGSPARAQVFNIGMTSGHSSLYPLSASPGSISVEVRELDDIVPPGRMVDFVKIDAEGAEREVFAGMAGLLRNPDISIAMEFAPSLLRRAGVEPEDLLHDIARAGFDVFLINEPDGALLPVARGPLLAVSGCNIFLTRPHARDWTRLAAQEPGWPS